MSWKNFLQGIVLTILAGAPLSYADENVIDLEVAPYLVTSGDPDNPIYANVGENRRSGVGSIFIQFASGAGFICTASAISPTHILTAGHCVRNGSDTLSRLRFVLTEGLFPGPPAIIDAVGFTVHPEFDFFSPIVGAFAPGDLAVVELAQPIPAGIETYTLYREQDELRKETQHYGYGRGGVGDDGATEDSNFFYGRTGKNQYDGTFVPLIGVPVFDQLISDFDNGTGKNDAAPWWYSPAFLCPASISNGVGNATKCNVARGQANTFREKGFGELEVGVAPGDSGGPGFIDDKIAGVHSFGFTYNCGAFSGNVPDVNCVLDSSYGEMSGDTRVSNYADWVDGIVAIGADTPIPEPVPSGPASGGGTSENFEMTEQVRYVLENTVARSLRLEIK